MTPKRRILVVDDEDHIVELLEMSLRQNGFDTVAVRDGLSVHEAAVAHSPDLILLDLMLPGLAGLEACRILRQDPQTAAIPVIMLTAKSEESDKVIGLGIGADDYVTKPFSLRELLARIEAVLRRVRPAATYQGAALLGAALLGAAPPGELLSVGDLSVDIRGHAASLGGESLTLSPTEFSLLSLLASTPGRTVRRADLQRSAGLADGDDSGRSLDVHIRNIRMKLGDDERSSPSIMTVRGIGYSLHA
jgi:DNA-binding response OmpR family regulator